MFSKMQNLFNTYCHGVLFYRVKTKKIVESKTLKDFEDIKIHLDYLQNRDDFISIMCSNDSLSRVKIFKNNKNYVLQHIKNSNLLELNIKRKHLMNLLNQKVFKEIIKEPLKFGFSRKRGFTLDCSTNNIDKSVKEIGEIIDCINIISFNDVIIIYDEENQIRFLIEIYQGEYSLSMLNYYRDFTKDELIQYLSGGFIVFQKIFENPEKEGFVLSSKKEV